jgi:aminoglycoside phosphotransferase
MQVGDLVTYYFQRTRWLKGQSVHVGLVVETGKYTGNKDVKVMWKLMGEAESGKSYIATETSQHLSLVDDSLTT